MNASEMRKKLEISNRCDNLDEWINSYLFKRFCETSRDVVAVNSSDFVQFGWKNSHFEAAMEARGYIVDYKCDDRPCTSPYFEIRLPK